MTAHIRDNVNFHTQRGEGAGKFMSVVSHPALHGGEFTSDEAEFHLQNFRGRIRVVE
jgi:hypothetical protein